MKILNDFNQNCGGQPTLLFNNLDDFKIVQDFRWLLSSSRIR